MPATRIVFVGESAGGALIVLTIARIVSLGVPVPAGAALLSPWVDLRDTTSPSFAANASFDYLPVDMIRMFAKVPPWVVSHCHF